MFFSLSIYLLLRWLDFEIFQTLFPLFVRYATALDNILKSSKNGIDDDVGTLNGKMNIFFVFYFFIFFYFPYFFFFRFVLTLFEKNISNLCKVVIIVKHGVMIILLSGHYPHVVSVFFLFSFFINHHLLCFIYISYIFHIYVKHLILHVHILMWSCSWFSLLFTPQEEEWYILLFHV